MRSRFLPALLGLGSAFVACAAFKAGLRALPDVSLLCAGLAAILGIAASRARKSAFSAFPAAVLGGAAAGCLVSGLGLLGMLGESWTILTGALCASPSFLAGLRPAAGKKRQAAREPAQDGSPLWPAAFLVLWGCVLALCAATLSRFLGGPLLGFSVVFSAVSAGAYLGFSLGPDRGSSRDGASWAAAGSLVCAAAPVLVLNFIRFVGLSEAEPLSLLAPVPSLGDFFFLAGQAFLLLLPAGFAPARMARAGVFKPMACAWAPPAAAAVLCPAVFALGRLHDGKDVLAAAALILFLGAIRAWPLGRTWRLGAAAASAALVLLGFKASSLWTDVDLYRLNATFPGAAFLVREYDNGHELAVADLREGGRALLRDGVLAHGHGAEGPLLFLIPRTLHESKGPYLILGSGEGMAPLAAMKAGGDVDVVGEGGIPQSWLGYFASEKGDWPKGGVRFQGGSWLEFLRRKGPSYGVIALDLPRPLDVPPSSDAFTRDFLAAALRRLEPGGIFAVWVPLPAFDPDMGSGMATMKAVFPYVAAWSEPGSAGLLLMGSSNPFPRLPDDGAGLIPWRPADEQKLIARTVNGETAYWSEVKLKKAEGRPVFSLDRSMLPFPAARLLAGERPRLTSDSVLP